MEILKLAQLIKKWNGSEQEKKKPPTKLLFMIVFTLLIKLMRLLDAEFNQQIEMTFHYSAS